MLELKILESLIKRENFARKALPYLRPEYFSEDSHRLIFEEIDAFTRKYNTQPTPDALEIEIESIKNISDSELEKIKAHLQSFRNSTDDSVNDNWLSDQTEKFCQEKSLYHAMKTSIEIMNGTSKTLSTGSIPKLLTDALSISFDPNIGHNYIEDSDSRFDFYHKKEERLPFDIDFFNQITNNGLPKKTLNVLLAGTGMGKTLVMCHFASHYLTLGKNVLYISLEMSEKEIAKRIDANLLNIPIGELMEIPKDMYDKRISNLKNKTNGKLIIKEYPTASAGSQHFKALLNELLLKKSFKPDVLIIDYINICMSSRIKPGSNINSYSYIKAIAEELRGLAVESDVPLITATQTNRTGYSNSDVELTDTSDSFGLPMSADFMVALIRTEEMDALNQIMIKQLKNRYNDATIAKRFVVGIDRAKMKLYNAEGNAQDIIDSGQEKPAKKTVGFGQGNKPDKNRFKDLKVK